MSLTATDVIRRLDLKPLSDEGGYFAQTWQSEHSTAIYYLLTPDAGGFSALHRLRDTEIYHFYAGDPVELSLFPEDGGVPEKIQLGNRLEHGEIPQYVVPGGTVQGSCLVDGGRWALLGTTMAPGYRDHHFELCDPAELTRRFPACKEWIYALCRKS